MSDLPTVTIDADDVEADLALEFFRVTMRLVDGSPRSMFRVLAGPFVLVPITQEACNHMVKPKEREGTDDE